MNILFLAPHPFYQDRGTPIAVNRILKALSQRGDEQIDVVTYHEGQDVNYNHVTVRRIPAIPLHGIRPGFSWKKIVCDALMFFQAMRLVFRKRYQLIHAVEESVFMALVLKRLVGIPYVYDMDSSLPRQLLDSYPLLNRVRFILDFFEKLAVRNAKAVVAVCEVDARAIDKYKPERVFILHDVSVLSEVTGQDQGQFDLRAQFRIGGVVLLYAGSLEPYQGIDLLLESFVLVLKKTDEAELVVIGGEASSIEKYSSKASQLSIQQKVHFLGPRPVEELAIYLSQADILVSPRLKGTGTPSKLYSYLHSGKAILATDLLLHTQLLDNRISLLVEPTREAFSDGMYRLIKDSVLRTQLGAAGKRLVETNYTHATFCQKVDGLYDWLKGEIALRS